MIYVEFVKLAPGGKPITTIEKKFDNRKDFINFYELTKKEKNALINVRFRELSDLEMMKNDYDLVFGRVQSEN